jgi:hypothetical protein
VDMVGRAAQQSAAASPNLDFALATMPDGDHRLVQDRQSAPGIGDAMIGFTIQRLLVVVVSSAEAKEDAAQ